MTMLEKKLDALMRFAAADNEFDIANIRTEIRLLLCSEDPAVIYSQREQEVRKFLLELNAPESMTGYQYLVDALILGLEKKESTANMTWGIYAPIAVEHNCSIDKVWGAIESIINAIWDKAPYGALAKHFGGVCDIQKGRPSPQALYHQSCKHNQAESANVKGADRM